MAADMSLRLSPHLKRGWSISCSTPATPGKQQEADDLYLFDTPAELVCPITQAVFAEPVLTASGHVYERTAIERYLRHNQSDPMTRQPLVNKTLTPVFVLKSRAHEYRETAAKQCVERACTRGCPDPVRYLRRAVELVSDAGANKMGVRGLSQDTVDYVTSHPSNAYDRLALQTFAQGLFQAGYRDKAAAVYYHLLISGSDRSQQAQLLRRCLSCWSQEDLAPPSPLSNLTPERGSNLGLTQGPAATPPTSDALAPLGSTGSSSISNCGGARAAASDPHVYEKLVLLFDGHAALGWGQIIDMAGEAGLGEEFIVGLCEQLLFRPSPRGETFSCTLGEGWISELAAGPEQSWVQEKEILMKYVRVLCQGVKERCSETARRLQELEQWQQGPSSGGNGGHCSSGGGGNGALMVGGGRQGFGRRMQKRGGGGAYRPAWLGHPLVVASCLLLAVLADPQSKVGRVIGAVPILALLPIRQ